MPQLCHSRSYTNTFPAYPVGCQPFPPRPCRGSRRPCSRRQSPSPGQRSPSLGANTSCGLPKPAAPNAASAGTQPGPGPHRALRRQAGTGPGPSGRRERAAEARQGDGGVRAETPGARRSLRQRASARSPASLPSGGGRRGASAGGRKGEESRRQRLAVAVRGHRSPPPPVGVLTMAERSGGLQRAAVAQGGG